jgi:hypothetical protein
VGPAIVVVGILAVIGFAVGSFVLKQRRRNDLKAFAQRFGLTYSEADPYDLTASPFQLLQRGDGRGCENVLSGSFQGVTVKEADYWYYDESTDSKGNRSKTYHHYSIAIVDLALAVPYVSVSKENLFTRAADHLGLKDIEFESDAFNGQFNVKAPDKEFAFKIVDARMERFLLDTGGAFAFEIVGPSLLVSCHRRSPGDLVPLLGTAKGFVDHIPRLVWTEYGTERGTAPGAEHGTEHGTGTAT